MVDSAPEAMNTLKELATAITDHQEVYDAYVAQVSADLATKVDKVEGSRLITEAEATEFKGKATTASVTQALTDAKAYTDAEVGKIKTDTSGLTAKVTKLETAVGDENAGLVKDVADIKATNTAQDGKITKAQTDATKGIADAAAALAAAQAADAKAVAAQGDVDALEGIVGNASAGLVKDVNANKTAIAAINNAETGILKQAKGYTDTTAVAIRSELATERGRIDSVEAVNTAQDGKITKNTNDIGAEVTRAKAAEKANSDAIARLNGNSTVVGSVDKKIVDALVGYSNTTEVKNILSNVVSSLNLSIVEDKVKLTMGGVEGVVVTETTINLATDKDIYDIRAVLDAPVP